ncbi:hypothetical protein [Sunxiuqinia dokdonensis]|nr:hypothetical protein [Sunxiuqinia dokdonensis]
MKFKEAVELASKNEHLIGKKSDVGIIDQIVIYPTDSVLYEEFKKQFLMNDDHQSIDGNFKDHDVSVGVILNKFMIEENAVFCFSDIFNLEDSLGIIC